MSIPSALGYLEALLTGGPIALVTRFSVDQLTQLIPNANLTKLYVDSLAEAISEYASTGSLSRANLQSLVEESVQKNSYSLRTLELHVLQKEVATILLRDSLVSGEGEAHSLSSKATAKFTQRLLADDQSNLLKEVTVSALVQIREYISSYNKELSNLKSRLSYLEQSPSYIEQRSEIRNFLDKTLDDDTRKIIEELVPELSYLRFQYNNLKLPRLGRGPSLIVGRDEDLSRAATLLRNQKCLQIYGAPGVGKTTLARSLVASLQEEFPLGIISIDARGLPPIPESTSLKPYLEGLLTEIVKKFFVQQVSFNDPVAVARDILSLPDVLLYIDNLDNIELLDYLFEEVEVSNCLITSRTRAHNIPHLQIGTLARDHATELYTKLCGQSSLEQASFVEQICDVLGDLPLAIALVAKDAKLVSQSPQLVYERLIQAQSLILEVKFDSGRSLETSAYLAFRLSYENLDAMEKGLFLSLAFAPPGGVTCESLCQLAANSMEAVEDANCSPRNQRALARLHVGSLCEIDQSGEYSTHPLLREFALETAKREMLNVRFEDAQFALLKGIEEISVNRTKPFFEGSELDLLRAHLKQVVWSLQTLDLHARGGLDISTLYGLLDYIKQTNTVFQHPDFIQLLFMAARHIPEPTMEAEVWLTLGDMYKNLFSDEGQAKVYYSRAAEVTNIPNDDYRGSEVLHRIKLFKMQQLFQDQGEEEALNTSLKLLDDEGKEQLDRTMRTHQNASPEEQVIMKRYFKANMDLAATLSRKYSKLKLTKISDDDLLHYEIEHTKIDIEYSAAMHDTQEEAEKLTHLGDLYTRKGDFGAAIYAYSRAEQVHKDLGNLYGAYASALGMGRAYSSKNQYEKALSYFTRTLRHASNIGEVNPDLKDKVLALIANVLGLQEKKQKAMPLWLFVIINNGKQAHDAFIAAKDLLKGASEVQIVLSALENGDEVLNEYLQRISLHSADFSTTQKRKIAEAFSSASTLSEFQNLKL